MADLDEIFAPLQQPTSARQPASTLDTLFAPLRTGGEPGTVTAPPGAGATVLDKMRGREPGVDYTQGAPFNTRYNLFRATKGPEEEMYLKKTYGEGNYKKDAADNWLVKLGDGNWVPVYPSGMLESAKSAGAVVAGTAPTIAGGIGGGAVGTAMGGLPGGVAGAFIGAGGAKLGDEGVKATQGFYNKTPGELATEVGMEGGLAALFQGAPWAKSALQNRFYGATSNMLRTRGGVTPETQAITQSLEPYGVTPPISSVAPKLKALEYDRTLRNRLSGDPKEAGRIAAINTRMDEVLTRMGLTPPEVQAALQHINTKTEATGTSATGEAISGRLAANETALRTEEATHLDAARTALQTAYNTMRTNTQRNQANLAGDVAQTMEAARTEFYDQMRDVYGSINRAAGGARVVDTAAARDLATELMQTMDPQAVPPIIRRLGTAGAEGGDDLLTIEEAHNLRTALREMARVKDLSPIGQRRGNVMRIAGAVDRALMDIQHPVGPNVAASLRQADEQFGEGVVRFTNNSVNEMMRDVRGGRPPDPGAVADLLLDKKSAAATNQLYGMLPAPLQARVRDAHLGNILDSAVAYGRDGTRTLNPDALLRALDENASIHRTIFNQPATARDIAALRELALDFKALGETVDVTALPAGTGTSAAVRRHLEQALGARRALSETAAGDPRGALRSDNQALVEQGAQYVLANETRTRAAAQVLGPTSPEWQSVQREATIRLLRDAIVSRGKGLGSTVSSAEIEKGLAGLTSAQQALLWTPAQLADLRLLSQQARALFPELSSDLGASLAAANVLGNLPKTKAIRGYLWSQLAGKLADSPTVVKMLAGMARTDPVQARGLISYLMQSGVDIGANRATKAGGTPAEGTGFKATMRDIEATQGAVKKDQPRYQGPDL